MKILYVLGSPRCGSTVLGNVLGEMDGCFSAGEMRFLWERTRQRRLCGCQAPIETCEIWGQVLDAERARGGPTPLEMIAYDRVTLRPRHLPFLLTRRPGHHTGRAALDRYLDVLRRVYLMVGAVTGANVIVDTSKRPSSGVAAWLVPELDTYFLHLVRDPRAVAYSQSRQKPNPDGAPSGQMATASAPFSSLLWSASNLGADALRLRAGRARTMLMPYDDFVAQPTKAVQQIMRFVGEPFDPAVFRDERTVHIGMHHTVAGNADRFVTGEVTLRSDDRWLREMSGHDRRLVTVLTAPLIVRYGFPLLPRRP